LALLVVICQTVVSGRKLEFPAPDGYLLAGFVMASGIGIAGMPAWIVKTQVHLPLAELLVVMGGVFALFYVASLFGFELLNEAERRTLAEWWPVHAWRQPVRGTE
jgi:hypothetical protein